MKDPQRQMELCWLIREALNAGLPPAQLRPLETPVLAEIIDALAWHPYVNLDPRDGATLLLHLTHTAPAFEEPIRQLAEDALVLAEGDRISAGRAAVAAHALRQLLAGTPPEALAKISPGWEITLLARSWIERGIGDADRLREIIAASADED